MFNRMMKPSLSARDIKIISRQTRRRHKRENWHSEKILYLTENPNELIFIYKTKPKQNDNHERYAWMMEVWFYDSDHGWLSSGVSRQNHHKIMELQKSKKIVLAAPSDEAMLALKGFFDVVKIYDERMKRAREDMKKRSICDSFPFRPPVNEPVEPGETIEDAESLD
jgi:hypothetical protein